MSKEDIAIVIQWFENWIIMIDDGPYYGLPGLRERLNGLRGFVDVLKRERDLL